VRFAIRERHSVQTSAFSAEFVITLLVCALVGVPASDDARAAPISFEPFVEVGGHPAIWKDIATDGNGTWIVVVGTYAEVRAHRSTDNGRSFGPPVSLAPGIIRSSGPSIASDGAGRWLVVWQTDDSLGGTVGADDDLFYVFSSDGGVTWSVPAALNTDAATDETAAPRSDDGEVKVASNRTGTWIASWRRLHGAGGASDVMVSRLVDGGSWSAPAKIDDDAVVAATPHLAANGAGTWNVAWFRSGDAAVPDDDPIETSRSIDDGLTWSAPETVMMGRAFPPHVATNGAGLWLVGANTDAGRAQFARSVDDGATWTGPHFLVADDPGAGFVYGAVDAKDVRLVHAAGNDSWVAMWLADGPKRFGSIAHVVFAESFDGGDTWSAPVAVNTDAAKAQANRYDTGVEVASDGQGTWLVATVVSAGPIGVFGSFSDCPSAPLPGCKSLGSAGRSSLKIIDKPGLFDALLWRWKAGEPVADSDLGDPATSGDYLVCMYDHVAGTPVHVFEKDIAAGGNCPTKSCWDVNVGRVRYRDGRTTRSSVKALDARSGPPRTPRVTVKAAGAPLGPPKLPLALDQPFLVQLHSEGTGACWESSLVDVRANTERIVKLASD
jgi:hypothetical protein